MTPGVRGLTIYEASSAFRYIARSPIHKLTLVSFISRPLVRIELILLIVSVEILIISV